MADLAQMIEAAEDFLLNCLAKDSRRSKAPTVTCEDVIRTADEAVRKLGSGSQLSSIELNTVYFMVLVDSLYRIVGRKRILVGEHRHRESSRKVSEDVQQSRKRVQRIRGHTPPSDWFTGFVPIGDMPSLIDRVDANDRDASKAVLSMWSGYGKAL